MQNNKTLTLILTILFIIVLFIGGYILVSKFIFKSPTTLIAPKVQLEYWGLFESELVMDEMIKEYEKDNPNVSIHYVQKLPGNDLNEYKKTLFVRLRDGGGPDIFRVHSTWIPSFYSQIDKKNSAMTVDEFNNRFYPVGSNQCVTNFGEVVCLPLMYDGLTLLYNIDVFRNEGLDPQSIKTWEDLRVAAIKLTEYAGDEYSSSGRKQITRAGVALGDPSNVVNTADVLGLMFAQNGINIPNDLDTQKANLVFEFYTDFVKKDEVWSSSMPNSLAAFATGRSAMVFAKSDQILKILELNPTLNLGALPVPQLPLFGGTFTENGWASFWVESVSDDSSSAEKREAWKFLAWLSKEENQIKRFNLASKYKRFGEPYSAKTLRNNLINSPLLGPIVQTAPKARTGVLTDTVGNDVYVDMFNEAASMYIRGTGGGGGTKARLEELKEKYKNPTK